MRIGIAATPEQKDRQRNRLPVLTGLMPLRPFSDFFNVAASRPAKSPRMVNVTPRQPYGKRAAPRLYAALSFARVASSTSKLA
jgi:hypothetical protein